MQKMNKTQLRKWREDYTVWEMPCLGEGLYLHVHFDEKDDVKRMGGRWNPDPSGKGGHWWMPAGKLNKDCPIEDEENWGPGGSGTVEHWLNNHKMIAGQYGTLDARACKDAVIGEEQDHREQYDLLSPEGDTTAITVYSRLGITSIDSSDGHMAELVWRTIDDTRVVWNDLTEAGWRKIISATSEVSA